MKKRNILFLKKYYCKIFIDLKIKPYKNRKFYSINYGFQKAIINGLISWAKV